MCETAPPRTLSEPWPWKNPPTILFLVSPQHFLQGGTLCRRCPPLHILELLRPSCPTCWKQQPRYRNNSEQDMLPMKTEPATSKPCRNTCSDLLKPLFQVVSASNQSVWEYGLNGFFVQTILRFCSTSKPCNLIKSNSPSAMAAGSAHTVLLRSDGCAVACGLNHDGQCNFPTLDEKVVYNQISAGGAGSKKHQNHTLGDDEPPFSFIFPDVFV